MPLQERSICLFLCITSALRRTIHKLLNSSRIYY
jgi:hypothetical protein